MEKYISFACFQVVYTIPWDSLQNRCNVLHNLGRGESEVSAKLECKFFTVRLAFTCGHLKYVKCYTHSAGYTMDYPMSHLYFLGVPITLRQMCIPRKYK